jgi:TatD DNase family protein
MIDTHAHLNFPSLLEQIEKVVAESKKAGVTGIIIAGSSIKDSTCAIELAQKYPGYLFASVGIHPQKTDPENQMTIEKQIQSLENLILDAKRFPLNPLVALGETGLDFSEAPPGEETRPKEEQVALFQGHIKLARKYNLPLIIHAREAVDEVLSTLSNLSDLRGTFHCYAGGRKRISKILSGAEGWYFGFDGNLTYDEGLQAVLRLVPQERILIETDSPFLAPVPHRGETNTPAYLPLVQEKINEIFGRDLTKQIVKNSQKIFNLH